LIKVAVAASGVHVEGPDWFDKTLFGFPCQGLRPSLNELALLPTRWRA